jgi:hypothetical protein
MGRSLPRAVRGDVEQRAQLRRDGRSVVAELAPGDAEYAPALDLESTVARAVALEGLPGSMGLVAIELDDERMLRPSEVRFGIRVR